MVSMGFKPIWLKMAYATFGERNAIEHYFRTLKERLKGFYNNINAKSPLAVNAMAQIMAYAYNNLRVHQSVGASPLGW
jgi:transposase-like protein